MVIQIEEIVFLAGNMTHSGGTERVLSVIAGGLAERGYNISIISMWGKGHSFFPLNEAIRVFWLEEEAPQAGIRKKIRTLASILNQQKADFLVDVDIILGFYSFFLKRLRPQMIWISWEHFNYYYHFRKNHNLRKVARRLVAGFSDQLVVLSEEDKAAYLKKLRLKCKITRIYNPNPYENIPPKETEELMIFAAGRLTKAKGFDLLIESWKRLEASYPEWTLLVAGEGEERKRLEQKVKAERLKNLQFIGNVSNIEKYYKSAAIFALSSRDEGFGMVLLEAMDYSLPAVSYACKAGPGEIVEDGVNGFLVEPEAADAFADRLERLMRDEKLRRQMGADARRSTERF